MNKYFRRLLVEYWLPLLVWVVTIYLFSTDSFSGAETSRIVEPLLRFFSPGLTRQELHLWHGVIRKTAHVVEYFILAALAYRSFSYAESDPVKARLLTGAFFLFTALSDEFHQLQTVSRGASFIDVGYDCLGGVGALWLIHIYETRRLRSYSFL